MIIMAKTTRWIQTAIKPKNKGLLHKELHVAEDKKIPEKKLKKAEKAGGKLAQRAHFAENVKAKKK